VVAAVVLLGLGGSGIVCQRVAARGRYAFPYSTYGAGPDGTKALFVYAQEAGLAPRRWVQDLEGLPRRALLVAIGGCDQASNRKLSRYEISELSGWIDGGGVLLVAGAHDYLWDEAGVALDPPPGCVVDEMLAAELARAERGEEDGPAGEEGDGAGAEPDAAEIVSALLDEPEDTPPVWVNGAGVLSGLGPIPISKPGSIRTTLPDPEPLFTAGKHSEPYGMLLRRGDGAIVVLSSASLFQNSDLLKADGGVVFARLARALVPEGPILFDEYHLGVGERRSLGRYVRDVSGAPFVLQILIVIGFALLALGVRFGRPIRKLAPVPGGTASYVEGVGDLYARTSDAPAALALVAAHGLDEVAEHHHLTRVSPARMEEILLERGRKEAAGAVRRLAALADRAPIKGRQLVESVNEVDALVALAKGNEG
jgi:hypothetical protein